MAVNEGSHHHKTFNGLSESKTKQFLVLELGKILIHL